MKRFSILAALTAVLVIFLDLQQASPDQVSGNVPIKEFLGVNAQVANNPTDLAQVAGWVRDYHKWDWYEATQGVYTWSTGWQNLDRFYSALKSLGVKVMPGVERVPDWALQPTPTPPSSGPTPVPRRVPRYDAHASYLGALVSHYGDTIAAVENYNEPDTWTITDRLTPGEFGAMTAQDYPSVKAANPGIPMVLAGMAGSDTPYLDAMDEWAVGQYDVLNFHWYANGDELNGGISPEALNVFDPIDEMKAWRDIYRPGKPIWVTEFGWDTSMAADGRKSKIYAPEASAANYLLRALFLMMGHGVDKAFVYLYRDTTDNPAYLHYLYFSAGLVVDQWPETDGRKKVGWYYLATLKNILGDYVFDGIVSGGPNIYRYEFRLPGTDKRAAVMWARDGDRDYGFQSSYSGPPGLLVEPTVGSTSGTQSATDGNLVLTERPVFVLYEGSPPILPPTPTPIPRVDPPPRATDERLVNGDFENGFDGWYIPSWFSSSVSPSWSRVHSGLKSLKFEGDWVGPYVEQSVDVSPGDIVRFSGWVNVRKNTSGKAFKAILKVYAQWNRPLGSFELAHVPGTTDGWVPISSTVVMPDSTVRAE
ncbi:MAG: hypothetical protein EPO21_03305, partial [Chloroflexota bacterium]